MQLYDAWGKKDKATEWRAKLAPSRSAELLDFVRTTYNEERFATAAGLLAEALRADPKLGDDRNAGLRYHAACFAALAAAGEGVTELLPDGAARAEFRGQALGWLKAERDAWAKLLDSGRPETVRPSSGHSSTGRTTRTSPAFVTTSPWPGSPKPSGENGNRSGRLSKHW